MKHFEGKVAVITGAASGIGRAIAERCARFGMRVVPADMDEAALTEAEAALIEQDAIVLSVKTDVSKRGDVEDLARRAFDAFGQVHLLFNNAGVAAGGAAWEATWNDWEWVIGVNLWGVLHGVTLMPRPVNGFFGNLDLLAAPIRSKLSKTRLHRHNEDLVHRLPGRSSRRLSSSNHSASSTKYAMKTSFSSGSNP